ncbi:FAD:protein FMN transferase [Flavihumibacter rivuli]|uniref:FAD:protein FMN transferase n=1 Tax=Flavihumibacter rivuli TaxID=2838156 RepID=UPI001BDF45A3|nr:FAD:protein FMN transferase [Flavihumibacter rivuli]ULQ57712.1 FAD:protein FMN transferase [Flavihumibacter rivuli]
MYRLIFILFTVFFATTVHAQTKRFQFSAQKMGSPFGIILYAPDSSSAAQMAHDCYRLVDSLVLIFSDYIDSSELNRLCAQSGSGTAFKASPALFAILLRSKQAYELSGGNFDITLGPLTHLWRKARKSKEWPHPDSVASRLALTGSQFMILDAKTREVNLLKQGMQLDLGGIAQGYIAQQVLDLCRQQGFHDVLIDVSGDIAVSGKPPGKEGWNIAINMPGSKQDLQPKHLLLTDRSVTTSGDVYQYFLYDGKKYSHIIDPRTGYGITRQVNVTILANDCTNADWLTKACSLLPFRKARQLANSLGAELLVTELKNGKLRARYTKGLSNYWSK